MRVGQGVYSNTQPKEKRKIPPSHSLGLVWFQTNKKKEENLKKRSEKSHHNMYVLNNTCILYKTNMLKNNTQGLENIYISDIGMSE